MGLALASTVPAIGLPPLPSLDFLMHLPGPGLPPIGLPPIGLPPIGLPPIGLPPIGLPPLPSITRLLGMPF